MTPADDARERAIVDARLATVAARLGDRLTEEAGARIRARIERSLRLGAELRVHPLGNADEPEIVFVPYRAEP